MATAASRALAKKRAKASSGKVNVDKNYSPGSFSFKKSGRDAAYRGAARGTLKGGGSVIAAHRAGMKASRKANELRATSGSASNSG